MADSVILKTKESPRFEGQTLKWYAGNTFPYTMEVELTDRETGEPYVIQPEHRLVIRWYDKKNVLIHEFEFSNLTTYIDENDGNQYTEITMNFTEEISEKFSKGKYEYCVTFYGEYITTIGALYEAEVEICH